MSTKALRNMGGGRFFGENGGTRCDPGRRAFAAPVREKGVRILGPRGQLAQALFRVGLPVVFVVSLASCDAIFNSNVGDNLNELLVEQLESVSQGEGLSFFMLPDALSFQALPQDPRNPLSKARVQLGQLLFHDTALATRPRLPTGYERYSCASCHHGRAGFQAGIRQGIGEGGIGFGLAGEGRTIDPVYREQDIDARPVRVPSILNVAYQDNLLWNGSMGAGGANSGTESKWQDGTPAAVNRLGYQGPESRAIAAFDIHRLSVDAAKIKNNTIYRELFEQAFPDVPEAARITKEHAGLAIAAFLRTVVPNQAPFQEWLRGRYWTMSETEVRGALLFFGKARCVECHTGPALNTMQFVALGMSDLSGSNTYGPVNADDPAHLGRGGFTGQDVDLFRFKVPQLYNLADAGYYGHGSSFTRIRDVVAYKNAAVPQNKNVTADRLDERFTPLGLTDEEIDQITAFLADALRDPSLLRYEPEYVPSRNCIPSNDPQTRRDLRCR